MLALTRLIFSEPSIFKAFRNTILAAFFISFLGLCMPLYALNIYDKILPNNAVESLMAFTIGIIIVIVFDFLLKLSRSLIFTKAVAAADRTIVETYLRRRLDNRRLKQEEFPLLENSIREATPFTALSLASTVNFVVDAPFLIIYLLSIAFIGHYLVVVPIFFIFVLFITAIVFNFFLKKYRFIFSNLILQKRAMSEEIFGNTRNISATGSSNHLFSKYQNVLKSYYIVKDKNQNLTDFFSLITAVLTQLSYVLMIAGGVYFLAGPSIDFGLEQVSKNIALFDQITPGQLIACSILGGRALAAASGIVNAVIRIGFNQLLLQELGVFRAQERKNKENDLTAWQDSENADHRADAITASGTASARASGLSNDQALYINIRNVSFEYGDGQNSLFDNLSLNFAPGEWVGIVGPMGSGKSSLGSLLSGAMLPQKGEVLLNGIPTSSLSEAEKVEMIGISPQGGFLFDGTVWDNIAAGRAQISPAKLFELADSLGIKQILETLPAGLETVIKRGMAGISGGQTTAINILRSIILPRRLYVFDEPSAGIGNDLAFQMLSKFKDMKRGESTTFIISHDMNLLSLVDRIIVLNNGNIIMDGKRDNILASLKRK